MKGSRSLKDHEIEALLADLGSRKYAVRNQAFFITGIRTGFRVSELLSLKVRNVLKKGKIAKYISVSRRHMKGKKAGRSTLLHAQAQAALEKLIATLPQDPDIYLFQSRNGKNQPLDRRSAWKMLVQAYARCGLEGKLGTHCMRKTLAKRVYDKSGGNIRKVQEVLGHADLNSSAQYIPVTQDEVDDLVANS